MSNNYRNEVFGKAFAAIPKEIEFNRAWSNGTGYFDHAVSGENAPHLKSGEIVKCNTPGNRRLIIIGTRLGNVAIFDRYSCQNIDVEKDGIYVYNSTSAFDEGCWFEKTSLSEADLSLMFGEFGRVEYNIGWRINQLYESMKKNSK